MVTNRFCNIAISSLIVMGMTACSSDDPGNGGTQISSQADQISVLLNSTANRVTNYGNTTGAKAFTRALPANGVPSLGLTLPEKPTGENWAPLNTGDTQLSENSVVSIALSPISLDMNGKELLLKKDLTLTGLTGAGTIYVPGSKTLTLDGVSSTGTSIIVYGGGKLVIKNASTFTVENGASLMAKTSFYKSGDGNKGAGENQTFRGIDVVNNGEILTANEFHANKITLGAGSKTQIGTNLTADEALEANGEVSAEIISAQSATVTGTLVASKLLTLSNSLTVNGKDAAVYGNYIKAGQYDDSKKAAATFIRQENGSNIYVGSNGMINTYTYYNTDGKGSKINLTDGALAVLATKQIVTDGDNASFITAPSGSTFGVYFKRAYKGSVADANLLDWDDFAFDGSANVRKLNKENDFADITIPADETIGSLGFNPNKEGTKTAADYQLLRPTAEVTYGPNDAERNGRSATGVVVDGKNVYVCYHTNGTAQAGMLDYFTTTNDGHVTLQQSISAVDASKKNAVDWNNIVLDKEQHKLIGTGNGQKGGLITSLSLTDAGAFDTNASSTAGSTLEPLKATVLQKVTAATEGKKTGDGNAVIVNGDYYQVATLYGTETFNRSNLNGAYATQLGDAKFITKNGNNVYVSYVDDNNHLKVNRYAASNVRLDEPSPLFDAGTFETFNGTNGKSVMAVDGNDVYVCLGKNGLVKYTNGSLSGRFIPKDATYTADAENGKYAEGTVVTRGYCNGVCVKDDKIYIAYGSLGLIVLNKKDMTATTEEAAKATPEVARYTAGKSANFVAVDDNNNIYVAYGKNCLKVLKLVNKSR